MSFLSRHIAQQTGTVDPVAGPGSPHHDAPHHQKPEPATTPKHRVIHDGQRETAYEHEPYPRMLYPADYHPEQNPATVVVHSIDEHQQALSKGFRETPPAPENK